ncbi:XRE family transcriptional regulator (plasmid) [Azospirillum argentinense]|uniref:XRE family transcriptional regulator n=1 Tax=Azospirillum argentinense TaxID=2970906 RepID=A0A4D8PFL7_9PROT|nr:XRE family transcriptional regulator [Azospirillum argentinense]
MPYRLSTAVEERVGNRDKFGDDYKALLARLVAERRRRGLTQWDIARAMGEDQSQVSKLERRERRLDIIDFVRYCRALDVAPGEWLDTTLASLRGDTTE